MKREKVLLNTKRNREINKELLDKFFFMLKNGDKLIIPSPKLILK
jgi:hypothetical protein